MLRKLFIQCFVVISLLVISSGFAQREIERTSLMSIAFNASDVKICGDFAYLKSEGFVTFDINNPLEPEPIGYQAIPNRSTYNFDFCAEVGYLGYYMPHGGPSGVFIVDLSDPTHSTIVDTLPDIYTSYCMKTFGDIAIWGRSYVDLSTPEEPHLLGQFDRIPSVRDVEIFEDYFVYACERYGVKTVSWADPENPEMVSNYNTGIKAMTIEAFDHYVYVGVDSAGIFVFDMVDVTNPQLVTIYEDTTLMNSDMELIGDWLYFSAMDKLGVLDLSNPEDPTLLNLEESFGCSKMSSIGNLIYSVRGGGMNIIDVSDPENFVVVNYINSGPGVREYFVIDDQIITYYYKNIYTFDISDPFVPQLLGTVTDSIQISDIYIKDDRLFVSFYGECLKVYDISNPNEYQLISRFDNPDLSYITLIEDDLAITRNQDREDNSKYLGLLNISDIDNIEQIAEIEGAFYNVQINENFLYTALNISSNIKSLKVFDLAIPNEPVQAFELTFEQRQNIKFYIDNDRCYLYGISDDLYILDISDPYEINIMMEYEFEAGDITCICAQENRCYMGLSDGSLILFNTSNPELMDAIDIVEFPDNIDKIEILNNHLYVTHDEIGFSIVDISDPDMMRIVGFNTSVDELVSIMPKDDIVVVKSGRAIELFDCSSVLGVDKKEPVNARDWSLLTSYPNPFNSTTRIDYQLPVTSDISIRLFDIAGREITTLVDGIQNTGKHSVIWDAGTNVAGIYLIRMESINNSCAKKIVLMK